MNTTEIENAVAEYYNWRTNIIVPNVSWGLGIHECDLLICTPKGYLHEVEIKISKYDLLADAKKPHHHLSQKIRSLMFAIPEILFEHIGLIPKNAGILIVKNVPLNYKMPKKKLYPFFVKVFRKAKINEVLPVTEKQRHHLLLLGCMRQWKLRNTINDLSFQIENLRNNITKI